MVKAACSRQNQKQQAVLFNCTNDVLRIGISQYFISRPVTKLRDSKQMVLTVIFSLCHNMANLYEYIQVNIQNTFIVYGSATNYHTTVMHRRI